SIRLGPSPSPRSSPSPSPMPPSKPRIAHDSKKRSGLRKGTFAWWRAKTTGIERRSIAGSNALGSIRSPSSDPSKPSVAREERAMCGHVFQEMLSPALVGDPRGDIRDPHPSPFDELLCLLVASKRSKHARSGDEQIRFVLLDRADRVSDRERCLGVDARPR